MAHERATGEVSPGGEENLILSWKNGGFYSVVVGSLAKLPGLHSLTVDFT